MSLLVITLLLVGTLFYPYLEMQTMWYLLLLKHWVYQIRSDILLSQARKYYDRAGICLKNGKDDAAAYALVRSDVRVKKVKALSHEIELVIQNFRDRYV